MKGCSMKKQIKQHSLILLKIDALLLSLNMKKKNFILQVKKAYYKIFNYSKYEKLCAFEKDIKEIFDEYDKSMERL
jgi:hypothetical protein